MNAFSLVLLLVVLFAVFAQGQMMGGWRPGDVTDPQVVESAQFAVDQTPNAKQAKFKILQVNKQVVAGMKYDLVIQITRPSGECTINHFQVWDRFGERSLVMAEQLADKCVDIERFQRENNQQLRHE